MSNLNPTKIMAEHKEHHSSISRRCCVCTTGAHHDHDEPCLSYSLAEALVAKQNERDAWFDQAANVERHSSEIEETLEATEAKVARVETLVNEADNVAERALSRMFSGEPFPALLRTADVRAALADQPEQVSP